MLLLKTLLGKTYEAIDYLKAAKVADRLKAHYFKEERHLRQWEGAVEQFEQLEWLRDLRNRHAFHYMTQGQWEEALTDDRLCDGAYVILGETHGSTFFHWADVLASYPMFRRVNRDSPVEGLGTILDEVGELLSNLMGALAEGANRFMQDQLLDDDALGPATPIPARRLRDTHIAPFYRGERSKLPE